MRARFIHYVATLEIEAGQANEKYSGRTSGILEATPSATPVEAFKYIQIATCQSLGVMQSHSDQVVVELMNTIE